MMPTFTWLRKPIWWITFPLLTSIFLFHYASPDTRLRHTQCGALSGLLPGKVFYTGSEEYIASTNSYWTTFESTLKPKCVVTPHDTHDVETTIEMLSNLPPSSASLLSIRGGGHTPYAGSANNEGGITMNLSGLKTISVSQDRSIVSIGAGCIWENVYRKMDEQGLAVLGGRFSSIGVGGLTLGGGMSFFAARQGFTADNVVNFEVVLASGKAVNANATSNSDLWRALKGGTNNFGVVTRFDVNAFEQGKFLGGQILYDDSTSPTLLEAFFKLNRDRGYDEYAAIMQSHAFATGLGFINSIHLAYTKPVESPETLRAYTTAQPQFSNTMRISNLTDFTNELDVMTPNGRRHMYITATFKNNLSMINYAYDTFKKLATQLPPSSMSSISITLQPLPPDTTSKSARKGGNSLGLEDSDTALVLFLIEGSWDDPHEDDQIQSLGKAIHDEVVAESKRRQLWHSWIYLNYADGWQDPIESYGEVNKKNLEKASKRYDPKGFFQKRVSGNFKVFK